MPVFDFNATPDEKKPAECTYTVIRSNENEATIEKPMMILDNKSNSKNYCKNVCHSLNSSQAFLILLTIKMAH